MNNYLNYIDTPSLPESIIQEVYKSTQNPNIFYVQKSQNEYGLYEATDLLKEYTHKIFSFQHKTRVQKIHKDLFIHKDFERGLAYNYLIDLGGDNVETCFFDNDFKLVETHVIKKHAWHTLDVTVFHSVKNVTHPRLAITLFPIDSRVNYFKLADQNWCKE